jgi:hypothetical protein
MLTQHRCFCLVRSTLVRQDVVGAQDVVALLLSEQRVALGEKKAPHKRVTAADFLPHPLRHAHAADVVPAGSRLTSLIVAAQIEIKSSSICPRNQVGRTWPLRGSNHCEPTQHRPGTVNMGTTWGHPAPPDLGSRARTSLAVATLEHGAGAVGGSNLLEADHARDVAAQLEIESKP